MHLARSNAGTKRIAFGGRHVEGLGYCLFSILRSEQWLNGQKTARPGTRCWDFLRSRRKNHYSFAVDLQSDDLKG